MSPRAGPLAGPLAAAALALLSWPSAWAGLFEGVGGAATCWRSACRGRPARAAALSPRAGGRAGAGRRPGPRDRRSCWPSRALVAVRPPHARRGRLVGGAGDPPRRPAAGLARGASRCRPPSARRWWRCSTWRSRAPGGAAGVADRGAAPAGGRRLAVGVGPRLPLDRGAARLGPRSPARSALAGLAAVLALAGWRGRRRRRAVPARGRGPGPRGGRGGSRRRPRRRAGPGRRRLVGWKDWEVGRRRPLGAASLDLRQTLRQARLARRRRGSRSRSPTDRARPLRAVSLDEFDGVAFTLADGGEPRDALAVERRRPSPPDAGDRTSASRTRASASPWSARALSSCSPRAGPQRVDRARSRARPTIVGDAIRVDEPARAGRPLHGRRPAIPEPTPAELVAARPVRRVDAPRRRQHPPARDASGPTRSDVPAVGQRRPAARRTRDLGPYAPVRDLARRGRRRRGHAVRGGQPHRGVPAPQLHLRRGAAVPHEPARRLARGPCRRRAAAPGRLPPAQPPRLLPALRGRDGGDAALARASPSRVAVGYTGGRYDAGSRALPRARPRRALVGGGVVPGRGLAPVRPDAGPLGAEPGLGLVPRLRAEPQSTSRPGRSRRTAGGRR